MERHRGRPRGDGRVQRACPESELTQTPSSTGHRPCSRAPAPSGSCHASAVRTGSPRPRLRPPAPRASSRASPRPMSPSSRPPSPLSTTPPFSPSRPRVPSLSRRPQRLSLLLSLVLLVCLSLLQHADAATVSFQNCLSNDYLNNKNPVLLQWVPLHVDASFVAFNTSAAANDSDPSASSGSDAAAGNATHQLVVVLYGNVTGTRTTTALPAWNNSIWADPTFTDGKILEEPDTSAANPKLTTLHRQVDVLTYEPWNNDTNFCAESLTNDSCPLGPVFNTSAVPLANLPSINITHNFSSSYAFASFSTTFLIRYGDQDATTIGCVTATVTPDLGHLAWVIRFLPLLVLLVVGLATIFAGIYSPWGTVDIFHWTSNYGRDPDLLRLVTPGFGDCLQYLQFAVLTGGLSLSYPGFFQPIVSQASWSTLMFNQTFVSRDVGMPRLMDGIYYTNGTYGMQNLAQLVGMSHVEDVWPGMMVWLLAIVAAALVVFQLGFGAQWVYRFVCKIPEEDLRSKNLPFSVGNVIRIVFNYFLLPLVALSTFQFVVAPSSPTYTVALAAVTLVVILGFAAWLLYLIISTRPRAVLFDDLQTLLVYGPLYNTYSDEAAAYALVPVLLTLIKGIAIGAVQPAGIAQIVLLAICEVVQILTLHAFHPFHTQSSMNAYHTLFALLRFVTIVLMIAFIPALGVSEGQKGWIGYVILGIHAAVLVLGFFLNALQTMIEVIARMAGAGGDDIRGQTRGGLSKIFGMRQLSRRVPRRAAGAASRQSQLSSSAMLDAEDATKLGYVMPGGRIRSESAGSIGVLMAGKPGQRSSSALDTFSVDGIGGLPQGTRNLDSGDSSFTPTTAGEMSNFSFLPSPGAPNSSSYNNRLSGATAAIGTAAAAAPVETTSDPYYRPPRRARRGTVDQQQQPQQLLPHQDNVPSPADRTRGSWASGDWQQRPPAQGAGSGTGAGAGAGAATATTGAAVAAAAAAAGAAAVSEAAAMNDAAENDVQLSQGATPAPYAQPAISFSPRTDYTTREVDFYYGVRGQRLNSDAPSRKLGTGPADPTGPMASAAGWFRSFLGGKSKDKGKGFEVLRSSRMPPAMLARAGESDDDGPPPGVPVAMNVIRNGPIESDDEEDIRARNRQLRQIRSSEPDEPESPSGEADLLDEDGNPQGDLSESSSYVHVPNEPPMLPSIDGGDSFRIPSRLPSRAQSKASRFGGSVHGGNGGNGANDMSNAGAGIPPVPEATALRLEIPTVPRKSSRRHSQGPSYAYPSAYSSAYASQSIPDDTTTISSTHEPQRYLTPPEYMNSATSAATVSRLPFDRSNSLQGGMSEGSSTDAVTAEEYSQVDVLEHTHSGRYTHDERPTSIGYVQQGSINRIDPDLRQEDLLGSSAEFFDEPLRR